MFTITRLILQNLAKTGILLIRQFVAIRILTSFFNRLGDIYGQKHLMNFARYVSFEYFQRSPPVPYDSAYGSS